MMCLLSVFAAAFFHGFSLLCAHWICGTSHELYKCNIIIGNLIYESFRGQGLITKESIVAKELIKIGLLHAPVNHLQENMEISRGSVIEHKIRYIVDTNFVVHSLAVFASCGLSKQL